jgi:hypothetical protein
MQTASAAAVAAAMAGYWFYSRTEEPEARAASLLTIWGWPPRGHQLLAVSIVVGGRRRSRSGSWWYFFSSSPPAPGYATFLDQCVGLRGLRGKTRPRLQTDTDRKARERMRERESLSLSLSQLRVLWSLSTCTSPVSNFPILCLSQVWLSLWDAVCWLEYIVQKERNRYFVSCCVKCLTISLSNDSFSSSMF